MIHAEAMVDTWRRFGLLGPVHEAVHAGAVLTNGNRLMRVQVVESYAHLDC